MDAKNSPPLYKDEKLALRSPRRFLSTQQRPDRRDDVDRLWRECIALNRFGARTEDYTLSGSRH